MDQHLVDFATFNNMWNCFGYHTETNEIKNRLIWYINTIFFTIRRFSQVFFQCLAKLQNSEVLGVDKNSNFIAFY